MSIPSILIILIVYALISCRNSSRVLAWLKAPQKSLVVVMHKYDAWKSMFPIDLSGLDYSFYSEEDMCWKINMGNVKLISYLMREILLDYHVESFQGYYYAKPQTSDQILEYVK